MNGNLVFRIISYIVFVIDITTWKSRKNNITAQLGNCLLPLTKRKNKPIILVLILAPALIFLQRFRDFSFAFNLILSITAILATEVVLKDRILNSLSGVYENGFIVDGRFFLYSSVIALPTLSYEKESPPQEEIYAKSLKLVTHTVGEIFIGFHSIEEREKAIQIILEREPRLAP